MGYKIIWSEKAIFQVERTLNYLQNDWSQKAVNNFIEKLSHRLLTIKTMPRSGKKYKDSNLIRSIDVSDINRLYYEINEDYLEILSLFDNRQNPKKKKF